MANRKSRKKRKMQLKRQGLEIFTPHYDSMITTSIWNLSVKISKHWSNGQIKAGKMRGFEFVRPILNMSK